MICVLHGMRCIQCLPSADSQCQHQIDVLAEKQHIPARQQSHHEPHAYCCLGPQLHLHILMCWNLCLFPNKASSLTKFYCMTDLSGKHLLLHPSSGDSTACLQHYVAHRSASTSACIVMPKWNGLWRKYLRGMQLLKGCPVSNAMHVPTADVSHCDRPVQVYYDPVHVVDSVCNVVGPSGLTMHFQGSVSNAAANVFLDSCCSHTLMSASYARRMGFTVTLVNNPLQIEVASGTVCSSIGTCKVRLELQQFSANVTFSVVELAKQYDVILGEDWLSHHNATMS